MTSKSGSGVGVRWLLHAMQRRCVVDGGSVLQGGDVGPVLKYRILMIFSIIVFFVMSEFFNRGMERHGFYLLALEFLIGIYMTFIRCNHCGHQVGMKVIKIGPLNRKVWSPFPSRFCGNCGGDLL